jgi:hypothetical protein
MRLFLVLVSIILSFVVSMVEGGENGMTVKLRQSEKRVLAICLTTTGAE